MIIAITGASGHIGSNLCSLLIDKGHSLKVLVYNSSEGLPTENTEIIKGDITQKEDVDKLVEGADAVIHMAAKISIAKDKDGSVHRINKLGSENIVEASIKHNVRRLVYFSSIHTFDPFPLNEPLDETRALVGNAGSDYDRSKIAGEKATEKAREHGIETIVICPTSVFGPNDFQPSLLGGAIVDIYNGKIPALIPGGYDFVDVRDVARGTVLALEKGVSGEKYLMSGEFLTVKELAKKVGEIGQVKVTQRVISATLLRLLLPFFQLQSRLNGKPPIFTKESLKALTESNQDIRSDKATKDFGYQKTPIDVSIKDTLDWFKQHGKLNT